MQTILNDIVYKIADPKVRNNALKQIVEECLSKRPYAKILVLVLLSDPDLNNNEGRADFAKVIRQCVKTLPSEDLVQLGSAQREKMTEFERRYASVDLNGDKFENELAKIMNRYAKEGRNEQYAPVMENKKQVRFDNGQEEINDCESNRVEQ
jgi:hypothetical protein